MSAAPGYVELDAMTNFSFLEGGSHPGEMIAEAARLGLSAIGLCDRNTLAGVVRAHAAAKEQRVRFLVGSRLTFLDGTELLVYPRDRAAYGRLSRLLSIGKSGIATRADADDGGASAHLFDTPGADEERIPKGECRLTFPQAAALGEGLIALAIPPTVLDAAFERRLAAWRKAWPDSLYLAAALQHRGDDRARLARLAQIAQAVGAPMVATNAALYHQPERRPLQDVLACIREKTTIDAAGLRLAAHAERHLKPHREMARLFRGHEAAFARTLEIADACRFSLDELSYTYPDEPIPRGETPDSHLRKLTYQGVARHFPDGAPPAILEIIEKELRLIAKVRYAAYFLTVHDIVEWARAPERQILCQGRGSAANSVVCYCLGITSVDPTKQDVLFERFISEERSEPPDIDVDFEHERREQVMQYVYARYGRHRAAICATIIHYRPRSAIRDVGKALGLTEDVTSALANTVWGSFGSKIENDHVDGTGVKRGDARMKMALELTAQLIGFPRHLSQHVGGFILTQGPLVETVPIGNGAMENRTFIEWDKDDIDELRIMKVDILALGMLTCIRTAFYMTDRQYGFMPDLAMKPDDAAVYDMLCKADSLGVFQVESRAQMSMLPRLLPRVFYDLVVEVAIVRPGPIQGGMVHPYLKRRREKREAEAAGRPFRISFPGPQEDPDELVEVLEKTMGVPLFQEQAMRIGMVAAKFTGDEANGLRKAMATFRHNGTIGNFEDKMVSRMIERGYPPEFANGCFNQIKGFGEYGFPESHAASFALLVYVSSWLKCFYPEVFCAALLNSQPMGFYSPAQIVRDARQHGVEVRHPDVNASDWDCTLESAEGACPEPTPQDGWAHPHPARTSTRLGFSRIDGFREDWGLAIMEARRIGGPFASIDDLRARAKLPAAALDSLAAADALGSFALTRRPSLWAAKGLPRTGFSKTGQPSSPAPLFAYAGIDEGDGASGADLLPVLPDAEEVVADYDTIRLSLKGHPVKFLRERFAAMGAILAEEMPKARPGRRIAVAGVVLVRQRPGTAKGVVFLTVEDETGVANIVVWPKVFEQYRPVVMGARMVLIRGRIETSDDAPHGGVIHLIAEHIEDRTADLDLLSEGRMPRLLIPGDGATSAAPNRGESRDPPEPRHRHPRNVRVIPRSRDFH